MSRRLAQATVFYPSTLKDVMGRIPETVKITAVGNEELVRSIDKETIRVLERLFLRCISPVQIELDKGSGRLCVIQIVPDPTLPKVEAFATSLRTALNRAGIPAFTTTATIAQIEEKCRKPFTK